MTRTTISQADLATHTQEVVDRVQHSVELQSDGDFGPCLLQGGWAEAQRNTEPQKAVVQLEPGDTQEIGGLAQADLIGKISLQSRGVRIAMRLFMLHLDDGAPGERLKEPEVEGIKKHGLVSSGLFDERHLPAGSSGRGRSIMPARLP